MPLTTLDPNTCRKASSTGVSSSHRRGHRRNARLDRCFPCEEPSARAGQCGGTGAGPDGTGSARQHIVFGGGTRSFVAVGSTTERYRRHEAKLGRVRNDGS
jgi:hypothetical protein